VSAGKETATGNQSAVGVRELLEAVRPYLLQPRCAVLSTVSRDGGPRQAVVHYMLAPSGLVVNGRTDRRWTMNLRLDPRVSVLVHDVEQPLHWVGVTGTATITAQGRAAIDDAVAIAERYGEDPTPKKAQERISYLISALHVYEYGSAG
jgi:PPOX class probable F420-dependent enzyme